VLLASACTAGIAEQTLFDKGLELCIDEIATMGSTSSETVSDLFASTEFHRARSSDFGPVRSRIQLRMEEAESERHPAGFWRIWEEQGRTVFAELVIRLDVAGRHLVCEAKVEPSGKDSWTVAVTLED
jgi:hypothetical protein